MGPAEPERLLAGRYQLRTIIGRGGMGVVWRARDELLGRDVAVKEIIWPAHLDAAEWDLAKRRAQREAQVAARLSHPNVVGIFDVVAADGRPWIIMELVPYRSLRDRVQADGPLTPAEAAHVGLGILAALRAAHKAGVLHRDVKPANVLLAPEGRVVLTDFGIARATDSPALTGTGILVGSPSYISPERARGRRAAAPADLWGLGACLYAAVEGRPPFNREGALASLTAVVTDEPDPPAHAGPLWPAISGLLRKDPDQRLGADEVEGMLRQIAESAGPQAPAMTVGMDAPFAAVPSEGIEGPEIAGSVGPKVVEGLGAAEAVDDGDAAEITDAFEVGEIGGVGKVAGAGAAEGLGATGFSEVDVTSESSRAGGTGGVGSAEAGEVGGAASADGPAEVAPVSEGAGEVPAGEADEAASADGPAEVVLAGEAAGRAPAGEAAEMVPDEAAGEAPASEAVEAAPHGEATGKALAGEPGEAPAIGVPREASAGRAAGEVPAGQAPAGEPGQALAGGAPEQALAAEGAGEMSAGEAPWEAPDGGAAREAPAGPVTGPLPAAEQTGGHVEPERPEAALPVAAVAAVATAATAATAATNDSAEAQDAAGPPRGRGRRGRMRILLAAAAAAVVVAAVVVGLVLTAHGSAGSHGGAPAAASHSASASARPSASPSARSSPSSSPSPSASASASGGSSALPAGYYRFTNSTGFSIGVPTGWQISHVGHYVYVRDPSDSGIFLLIDQSDQPQPNALADWKQQAATRQSSYPGYHLLRLQPVSYPQAEQAADWEFTYERDGVPVHILNRNVLANATHAYALYWSTPDSEWSADYHYFQAFAATFRPAS